MIPARSLLLCLSALLISGSAHAVVIPGLFNTGVDAAGAVLPGGSVDPHYTLIASADPNHPGPGAIVATLIPTGFWFANNSLSRWIAPAADENYPALGTPHPAGTYTYRLSFDLTGIDPGTVVISGNFGADNSVIVRLNGVQSPVGAGYNPLQAFSFSTGAIAGVNHLDFIVTNLSASGSNPTGLRVQGLVGTGTATTGVEGGSGTRQFGLAAPFPNPSQGVTRLGFTLAKAARIQLRVVDLSGRTVRTLVDRECSAGQQETSWDGVDDAGTRSSAGIYLVELTAGGQKSSRRIAWIK